MAGPDLSIVIPTCDRGELLRQSIAAVRDTTRCAYELIIVDGASSDCTADVLAEARQSLGDRLRVIREERREGFTRGINKGFRAATGRFLTWLNDDARPVPGAFDLALEQLESSLPSVGVLALFHQCQTKWNVAYATTRRGKEYKLLHVRGTLYANFAFGRRQLFERLGFFDERYYMNAGDPDFSLKVWDAGLRVIPAFASLIDHDETEDDRRAADSPRGRADNQLLFAKWNLPPRNPEFNDFDPSRPCTLRGLRQTGTEAA